MPQENYLGGRYSLEEPFARGGMATVHLGRSLGAAGFSRVVAIKRLHAQFAADVDFRAMLLDEARLVSRIRHPNVVPVLDVVEEPRGLFLVMEYVHGETASRLRSRCAERGEQVPVAIAVRLVLDALLGLHAAHEATNEQGEPLRIVHRDISPQNLLVGTDGVTRVLDFGIAKAAERSSTTKEGEIKGKMTYLSPEQLLGGEVDRRCDLFSAGIVLWELLAGHRLVDGKNDGERLKQLLSCDFRSVREVRPEVSEALDAVVMKALQCNPEERFESAATMASALELLRLAASASEVGAWMSVIAAETLLQRSSLLARIESSEPRGLPVDMFNPSSLIPAGLDPPSSSGAPGPAREQTPVTRMDTSPEIAPRLEQASYSGVSLGPVGVMASESVAPPTTRSPGSLFAVGLGGVTLGVAFGVLLEVTALAPKTLIPSGSKAAASLAPNASPLLPSSGITPLVCPSAPSPVCAPCAAPSAPASAPLAPRPGKPGGALRW